MEVKVRSKVKIWLFFPLLSSSPSLKHVNGGYAWNAYNKTQNCFLLFQPDPFNVDLSNRFLAAKMAAEPAFSSISNVVDSIRRSLTKLCLSDQTHHHFSFTIPARFSSLVHRLQMKLNPLLRSFSPSLDDFPSSIHIVLKGIDADRAHQCPWWLTGPEARSSSSSIAFLSALLSKSALWPSPDGLPYSILPLLTPLTFGRRFLIFPGHEASSLWSISLFPPLYLYTYILITFCLKFWLNEIEFGVLGDEEWRESSLYDIKEG